MIAKELQKRLKKKNSSAKILYIKKIDEDLYWIVYSDNPTYIPEEAFPRDYLADICEKDILASDYEEAVEFIANPVKIPKECIK